MEQELTIVRAKHWKVSLRPIMSFLTVFITILRKSWFSFNRHEVTIYPTYATHVKMTITLCTALHYVLTKKTSKAEPKNKKDSSNVPEQLTACANCSITGITKKILQLPFSEW